METPKINPAAYAMGMLVILLFVWTGADAKPSPRESRAKILFVNPKGGDEDCSSWEQACDLQAALGKAETGVEIWVAAGIYKPTSEDDQSASFELIEGVAIYGGFAGTETAREERDWEANHTILSGDIGVKDSASDNSYHVVTAKQVGESAILDGFTIKHGYAYGTPPGEDSGGGMFNDQASPTLANLIFEDNSADMKGGGMYNTTSSSPTLFNVTFDENSSNHAGGGMANALGSNPLLTMVIFSNNSAGIGGGMYNLQSSPSLNDVLFENNRAEDTLIGNGGGMHNKISNPVLTQVVFADNKAQHEGGGLYNTNSVPSLNSVTFSKNTAALGGGMSNYNGSSPAITNVTFTDNAAIYEGGGIHNEYSSPSLTHVTITGNSAESGGAFHNSLSSSPALVNAILWNNGNEAVWNDATSHPVITYSIVQGGYAGVGNKSKNPLLDDLEDNGGFTPTHALLPGSPAIDAGNQADCPAMDQRGMVRPLDGDADGISACDMGAYEAHTIIFVDLDATMGLDNGTTWADAFVDLQEALAYASPGNQIWVAAGTYFPTATNDRTISFSLKNSVGIYGGFAGDETKREDRDGDRNLTILSGDLGEENSANDNSYHVIKNTDVGTTSVLDGFIVTGGNANDAGENQYGGGMYNSSSSPNLGNITFVNNAAVLGGGIYNADASSPTLTNITISNNSADEGGGMYNHLSSPMLLNVTLHENKTNVFDSFGGGLYNCTSNPILTNTILWGNTPSQVSGSSATITYSIVQGSYAGEGNINEDPLLGDLADNGGFTPTHALQAGSPAIDAGSPDICPDMDQRGVTRPLDGDGDGNPRCDIGAYEFERSFLYNYLPLIMRK